MKFEAATTDAITRLVAAGNTAEAAAAACGVGRSTFYHWMAEGKGKRCGDPYRDFRDAIMQARARAECRAVALLTRGAERNPSLAMFLLERRNPKHWGRRTYQSVKLRGRLTHPITVIDPREAASALAALEQRLSKARSRLPRVMRLTPPTSEG